MFDVFLRFQEGGPFMWVLLFLAFWVLGIAFDRFIVVFVKASINGKVVMGQIEKLVKAGDAASAVKYCEGISGKPLARVLGTALVNINESASRIHSSMDETLLEVLPKLQKRTPYLFTLANVATLLGLLGTIAGLIQSFGSLDVSDPASQARQLGSGISMAMLTTAFGLIIAVPSIILHSIIQNKTEQIVEDIDHYSTKLLNLINKPSH